VDEPKKPKPPKPDDAAGLAHHFGEPGIDVTWKSDSCWQTQTRLVPTENGSVGYGAVRPRHHGAVPRKAPPEVSHREADAAALARELWDTRPAARIPLELAGFTGRNLWPVTRSRGQPRTPEVVFAAVAVLWEQHGRQGTIARLVPLGCSAWSVRKWRHLAYERELFDGPGRGNTGGKATAKARRLIEQDGREPEAIVAGFLRREPR
jgi:hypothetical protein